jgi:deoxyribose-phosphate aldolase
MNHPVEIHDKLDLARCIDHTVLRADAGANEIRNLCIEAKQESFASVCVNSSFVPMCVSLLQGTQVRVCTVVGFPLGAMSTVGKAAEAAQAVQEGAGEVDMVLHVGKLKDGDTSYVARDIAAVVREIRCIRNSIIVKVILETCLLSDELKQTACRLCMDSGADFVKTSTGFGGGGATEADVALMRSVVGGSMGVKASGGIKTFEQAMAMFKAGANRIGTSSGMTIIQQYESSRSHQQ